MSITLPSTARAELTARTALASLPLSFREPGREVVIIDGGSDWPTHVNRALQSGAAGILVIAPQPAEFEDLLTAGHQTAVVIDSVWASNPVVEAASAAFGAAGNRLECRVILTPGKNSLAALLDQLALVRALVAPVTELRFHQRSDYGFQAEGTTDNGVIVDFTAVRTSALPESATVRLLTDEGSVELEIPAGETAHPARLTTVGPDGALLAPTQYETGHRASLRRLRDSMAAESADISDLHDLHADAVVLAAAVREHPVVRPPA